MIYKTGLVPRNTGPHTIVPVRDLDGEMHDPKRTPTNSEITDRGIEATIQFPSNLSLDLARLPTMSMGCRPWPSRPPCSICEGEGSTVTPSSFWNVARAIIFVELIIPPIMVIASYEGWTISW